MSNGGFGGAWHGIVRRSGEQTAAREAWLWLKSRVASVADSFVPAAPGGSAMEDAEEGTDMSWRYPAF
jgi:hypothetical protein